MINGMAFDSLNDLVAKLSTQPDAFCFDGADGLAGTGGLGNPGSTGPGAFKVAFQAPAVFSEAVASMPADPATDAESYDAAATPRGAASAAEEAAMAEIEAAAEGAAPPGGGGGDGAGGSALVVTMTKENGESWGFGLDPEYLLSGVHSIMSIADGSVAARYAQLQPGVAIAAIGASLLDGIGLDQIADLIKAAGNSIVLTLGAADGAASPPPAVAAYEKKAPEAADDVMARTMADAIRKIEAAHEQHRCSTKNIGLRPWLWVLSRARGHRPYIPHVSRMCPACVPHVSCMCLICHALRDIPCRRFLVFF